MKKKCNPHTLEDYRVVLDMIHVGMIDIRASGKVDTCKAIADIFHNVPNLVMNKAEPDEIYEVMFRIAKRNGFAKYVDNLQKHCTKKVMQDKAKTHSGSRSG